MNLADHKTKIVCTIGPASESREVMERMARGGMNVARLNFSHGDFAAHKRVIDNLRAVSMSTGCRIAIMADLSGPKMRIGKLKEEPIELNPGDPFVLTTDEIDGDRGRVSVSFNRLPQAVKPGDALFLNDGIIQLEVESVTGSDVVCRVVVGGELRSRKGLNLPGINLGINAFTERDHACLKFAAQEGVDAVSQSFVESGADIRAVRQAAEALDYHPFIIAKIERSNALEHMDDILDAADGIMIARGDLGVEVPIERIAIIQKDLMRQANRYAKPVITATQMLESMTENRRPTRAEATDVANAILDGTDCVMLSGESAMGKYPVDAVEMLARIAATVEPHKQPVTVKGLFEGIDLKGRLKPGHLIAMAVEASITYAPPAAVFVPTHSGLTARSLSLFRMPVWTVAVSSLEQTCQNLAFSYGVFPVFEPEHPEDWDSFVRSWLAKYGVTGDMAILTEGPSTKHPGTHNRMEIIAL
ncbi:pyruvate kinase [Geotalea uraniireducens]|uniref:Pyruvate kinase n=1 Tax=Geotalea uraniireducens (strain Rf4) TaxID=351605 RepID=A5G4W2_GEOUR|nr:pyruvate kinase [Geotalea uraniireducens]ABQ26830.1 pyruvate kinase [Geotalea uraniireducens Rf4]